MLYTIYIIYVIYHICYYEGCKCSTMHTGYMEWTHNTRQCFGQISRYRTRQSESGQYNSRNVLNVCFEPVDTLQFDKNVKPWLAITPFDVFDKIPGYWWQDMFIFSMCTPEIICLAILFCCLNVITFSTDILNAYRKIEIQYAGINL